jgi:hypothetical protein
MGSRFRASYVWPVVIFIFGIASPQFLGNAQTEPGSALLSKPVTSFTAQGLSLVDALLQLGQQEEIPLGIEYVDRESQETPTIVKMEKTTVGAILEKLVAQERGCSWRVREGVLTVTQGSAEPARENLLNRMIPQFSVSRCSVSEASNLLWMDLEQQLDPTIKGFAGDFFPADGQNLIGPLTMRNAPVWRVLNRLVTVNQKGAWIVQVANGRLDKLPGYGLWRIVEYQRPLQR